MAADQDKTVDAMRKLAADLRAEDDRRETARLTKAAQVLCAARGLLTLGRKVNAR